LTPDPTPIQLLELDLDVRLLALWLEAWGVEEWDAQVVAPFLRLAYWSGYKDALTEPRRGVLYLHHGESVPPRKRLGRS